MNMFTIGFTRKSAEYFFQSLRLAGVARVIDVRLNNVSQLAGFAKREDLRFFLRELCDADYVHLPELAPEAGMLKAYKQRKISWQKYEGLFLDLLAQRNVERTVTASFLDFGCLLCSEHEPHYCHRRVVVDYLNAHGHSNLVVEHLL